MCVASSAIKSEPTEIFPRRFSRPDYTSMSAVGSLKGDMPQQVRSLVSLPLFCALRPSTVDLSCGQCALDDTTSRRNDCPAAGQTHFRRDQQLLTAIVVVPPTITAGRPVLRVQLPRICEAKDERCVQGQHDGARSTQGSGVGPEGPQGATRIEGIIGLQYRGYEQSMLTNRQSGKQSSASSTRSID